MARRKVKQAAVDDTVTVSPLRRVAPNSLVRIDGRWGVAISSRIVDFWHSDTGGHGGREFVDRDTLCEVLRDPKP